MTFWVDRHRPFSLGWLDNDKGQVVQQGSVVQCGNFPHLLVSGPPGTDKKTRMLCVYINFMVLGVEKWKIDDQRLLVKMEV